MQTNQQGFPRISSPLVNTDRNIEQIWLQFFISLWERTGAGPGDQPSDIANIVVTDSPFRYQAAKRGNVWIDQGTYCQISMTRGTETLQYGFVTRGIFPLSVGDVLTVAYANYPPTMHFI